MGAGDIFLLVLGIGLLVTAGMIGWTGRIHARSGAIRMLRSDNPALFWLNVAILVGLAGLCLWRALLA